MTPESRVAFETHLRPGRLCPGSWLPGGIDTRAGTGLALRDPSQLLPAGLGVGRRVCTHSGGPVPGTCGGFWRRADSLRSWQAGSPCPREVSSGGTGNVCGLSTAEKPGGWNSPDHVVWRLPCTCPGPRPPGLPDPFASRMTAGPASSGVGGLPRAWWFFTEILFCENSRFLSSRKIQSRCILHLASPAGCCLDTGEAEMAFRRPCPRLTPRGHGLPSISVTRRAVCNLRGLAFSSSRIPEIPQAGAWTSAASSASAVGAQPR